MRERRDEENNCRQISKLIRVIHEKNVKIKETKKII